MAASSLQSQWDTEDSGDDSADVAAVGAQQQLDVDLADGPANKRRRGRPPGRRTVSSLFWGRGSVSAAVALAEPTLPLAVAAARPLTANQQVCQRQFELLDPRYQGKMLNAAAIARDLGVDDRQVPRILRILASTAVASEKAALSTFHQVPGQLKADPNGDVQPLALVTLRKYDETPIKLVFRGQTMVQIVAVKKKTSNPERNS